MHFKRGQKALALATALVALFGQQHSVMLAATACCEGTIWLKASKDSRTSYVGGFIEGLTRGFGQGCLSGTRDIEASKPGLDADPLRNCLTKSYTFSRDTEEYVKLITDFYRRYPDDRGMPTSDVLLKLSRGLGLEQIHLEAKLHRASSKRKGGERVSGGERV
jgi:hypothetical protein